MPKSIIDTQIDILLEEGRGLKCGLTKQTLVEFFKGKENLILKNGIVLVSYGCDENDDNGKQSRALISLAEKYLTEKNMIVFENDDNGKTCLIIGKPASELSRLAICDLDKENNYKDELIGIPCKFPKGRKLKYFGNKRLKDFLN